MYSAKWNKIPAKEAYGNFELLLDEELAGIEIGNSKRAQQEKSNQSQQPKWK